MEAKYHKYMVECTLPPLSMELQEMIPRQRVEVDKLFHLGVLLTYTLASDRSKLWIVIQADTESELLTYIDSMPILQYCDYDYHEIMFHDTSRFIPSISLN